MTILQKLFFIFWKIFLKELLYFETTPFHFNVKDRQTGRQIRGRLERKAKERDQTDRQTRTRSDRKTKEMEIRQKDKRDRDQTVLLSTPRRIKKLPYDI